MFGRAQLSISDPSRTVVSAIWKLAAPLRNPGPQARDRMGASHDAAATLADIPPIHLLAM